VQRALAPYAISAALVVVISIAVLAGALAAGGLLEPRQLPDATPTAQATRAPIELSRNGRIAYWRPDGTGSTLWVTNIDGSQRRSLTTVDLLSRVGATRWSPDGNAVAYLDRAQGAVIVRLDGSRSDIPLPAAVTQSGARLVELEWSTDSRSIASTLRTATGFGTDVYVASASGGGWRKVTAATNGSLSQWISPDELLIHTQEGLIGVLRSDGTALRPLTGLSATSPFVADDGRVYFLAGQIAPQDRGQAVPVVNAAQARVWSMTLDGGDVRQETTQRVDDIRLAGRWPTGRFMIHQGASTSLAFLGTGQVPLETVTGVIDRVTFSPDRRTAIGVNASRIFRYDVAQPDQPVLLLSDVAQPDAWYPQNVTAATTPATPVVAAGPTARFTFAMHGIVWATDASGGVHLVRRLQTDARSVRRLGEIAVPQWSPRGDRIVYFDVVANSFQGAIFVTDPTGTAMRVSDQQDAAGPFPSWSPDGNVAYTQLLGTRDSSEFGADSDVRIVTPTGTRVTTYRAREIAFGGGRTFLIDNGKLNLLPPTRAEHSIVEVTGGATRSVTSASYLSVGLPFTGQPAIPATLLQLSQLGSSGDGKFLSVRISPATGGIGFEFAIISAQDGAATRRLPGQTVADARWSPTGHLIGFTLGGVPRVVDAGTGAVVASATEGRFAGWSPDGTWFYVARDIGLYAIALAGGDAVRVSAFGVPVSATP